MSKKFPFFNTKRAAYGRTMIAKNVKEIATNVCICVHFRIAVLFSNVFQSDHHHIYDGITVMIGRRNYSVRAQIKAQIHKCMSLRIMHETIDLLIIFMFN